MQRNVIFFDGPIGVGKSSLGRAVADSLGAGFIDGDDHSGAGPWLRSILRTSRAIADASLAALQLTPCVIVAYPLRTTDWRFYSARFARAKVRCLCIGLTANPQNIANRARKLSADELARSAEMIAQGYGTRAFNTLTLRTDASDFETTRATLTEALNLNIR